MQTVNSRFVNQPILGVKRRLWRKDDEHLEITVPAFHAVRNDVLMRDNFTCHFCGFKSEKWQEIHHIDSDHQNNTPDNLVTSCNLCHQVHHLGMCAMNSAGFLAVVPELAQTEINHLVRAIHVAEKTNGDADVTNKLKSLYAIFQFRGQDTLKNLFELDISSPFILAEVLANCPDDIYEKRSELFQSLRLIATEGAFAPEQLTYYAKQHSAQFASENWIDLARRLEIIA